ncbi:hypothetical protein JFL43_07790 [Viridibacillus sp. YIM B01967]|uniref:Pectate lyase n=1 Tax=Viridibacillus soli TaxID=2798301 RepID=A0ABS1H633_9BACL|nr:hypothetical protein [Viridibacillus soli]MBK3494759.1 hypothetical protein [Viridibacillus soli]
MFKILVMASLTIKFESNSDGARKTLAIATTSAPGNNTTDGVFIHENNVTLKNITVTRTHEDNLIEIYGDYVTLEDVTVSGGRKAGVYVNNNGTAIITVYFKGIHTSGRTKKKDLKLSQNSLEKTHSVKM